MLMKLMLLMQQCYSTSTGYLLLPNMLQGRCSALLEALVGQRIIKEN